MQVGAVGGGAEQDRGRFAPAFLAGAARYLHHGAAAGDAEQGRKQAEAAFLIGSAAD